MSDNDKPKTGSPYYIRDHMEPTRHMVDGKIYDSKSKFREVTKAHGCIEIGNETKYLTEPKKYVELDKRQRREDIRKAFYDVRNGKSGR